MKVESPDFKGDWKGFVERSAAFEELVKMMRPEYPRMSKDEKRRLVSIFETAVILCKTMPGVFEQLEGDFTMLDLPGKSVPPYDEIRKNNWFNSVARLRLRQMNLAEKLKPEFIEQDALLEAIELKKHIEAAPKKAVRKKTSRASKPPRL